MWPQREAGKWGLFPGQAQQRQMGVSCSHSGPRPDLHDRHGCLGLPLSAPTGSSCLVHDLCSLSPLLALPPLFPRMVSLCWLFLFCGLAKGGYGLIQTPLKVSPETSGLHCPSQVHLVPQPSAPEMFRLHHLLQLCHLEPSSAWCPTEPDRACQWLQWPGATPFMSSLVLECLLIPESLCWL